MVSAYRLTKEKQYPVPHDLYTGFSLNIDDSVSLNQTIIPNAHHDEAMLASNKYTHPEHASFSEDTNSNVCAESKIYRMETQIRLSLTKQAKDVDGIRALRVGIMDIAGAFEDFDATDELTSVSVGDVLELTKESTDRQTYPIYTGTDTVAKYTGSNDLGTDGMDFALTTDSKLETTAFDPDLYYDALNYYTISEKLKKVQSGLRWFTLTENNPTRVIKFRQSSSSKAANPYMFKGQLIFAPKSGTKYQIPIATETSSVAHLHVDHWTRFLEWNDNFNHERA